MRVIRDELRDEQGNDLALYAGILAAASRDTEDREPFCYEHPSRVTLGEGPAMDRLREKAITPWEW